MQRIPVCQLCNYAFGSKDLNKQSGPSQPLLLLCGHSFCDRCLSKLAKTQVKQIQCPACMDITPLRRDEATTKSLVPDLYKLGILAFNKKHGLERDYLKLTGGVLFDSGGRGRHKTSGSEGASTEPCGECGTWPASCLCIKCDAKMCSPCFEKIHQSKTLRKHKAQPLSDLSIIPSQAEMCSEHEMPIEYHCQTDGQLICSKCAIFGVHRSHCITTLEQKMNTDLEELEPLVADAHLVVRAAKKSNKILSLKITEIGQAASELTSEVNNHFMQLHSALQAREHVLLQEILENKEKILADPEDTRRKLLEEVKKLEFALADAEKLGSARPTQLGGGGEAWLFSHVVLARLSAARQLPCCALTAPAQPSQPQKMFPCVFKADGDIVTIINNHGVLDAQENVSGLQMCALSEMPDDYLDNLPLTPSSTPCATPDCASINTPSELFDTDSMVSSESGTTPSVSKHKHRKSTGAPLRKEQVFVTHIRDPSYFFVRSAADMLRVIHLNRTLNKYCKGPRAMRVKELEPGDLVLGQFTDQQWYRARVTAVQHDAGSALASADLHYLDYGNDHMDVSIDRLRVCPDNFLRLPEMAFACGLVDIRSPSEDGQWGQEARIGFGRMTADKPMLLATKASEGDLLLVDLLKPPDDDIEDDRPVSVRDALVFLELAIFTSPLSSESGGGVTSNIEARYMRRYFPPVLPGKGERLDVIVSHANGPDSFFIQAVQYATQLQELMAQLQALYCKPRGENYPIYVPQKGMVCVAEYSEDKAWYRAMISALHGRQQCQVTYVDFGNSEVLPYFKLRKILDKFLVLPAQAMEAELADVRPIVPASGWSAQASDLFTRFCVGRILEAEVRRVGAEAGGVAAVGVGASRLSLALRGYKEQPNGGGGRGGAAGGVVEPETLNTVLVNAGFAASTGPSSMNLNTGRVAPEARPIGLVSAIPPQQLSTPPRSATKQRQEEPRSPARPITKRPVGTVAKASAPTPPAPGKPPLVEVNVTHVVHPGHLYIQIASRQMELDQLMVSLNRALRTAPIDEFEAGMRRWEEGDCCAVRYSQDTKWYRARVTTVAADHTYQVLLFDFGFTDMLPSTELHPLEPRFIDVAEFSTRCHLAGIQPAGDVTRWSRTACEYLSERVAGKATLFIAPVSFTADAAGSVAIDLLLEQRTVGDALSPDRCDYISLASELQEKGLALPLRSQDAQPASVSQMAAPPAVRRTVESVERRSPLLPSHLQSPLRPQSAPTVQPQMSPIGLYRASPTDSIRSTPTIKAESGDSPSTVKSIFSSANSTPRAAMALYASSNNSSQNSKETVGQKLELLSFPPINPEAVTANLKTAPLNPALRTQSPKRDMANNLDTQHNTSKGSPLAKTTNEQQLSRNIPSGKSELRPKAASTEQGLERDNLDDMIAALTSREITDYPAPDPLPINEGVQVAPTYVDFDGSIYAQVVYPDESPQGKLGYVLREHSVELCVQDRFLKQMGLRRVLIIRDNNSLFRCLAASPLLFGDQEQHMIARLQTLEYISQNWNLFQDLLCGESHADYMDRLGREDVAGGEEEIKAACLCFNVQIKVFMGGLHFPFKCKSYGRPQDPLIQLSYLAGRIAESGSDGGGQYDLVVAAGADCTALDIAYARWRGVRVQQNQLAKMQQPQGSANIHAYDYSLIGELMYQMQSVYRDSEPSGANSDWTPGQLCVCRYTDDGRYYRARVTKIQDSMVMVHYVDFGNSELVEPKQLRRQPCLLILPRQCVRLALWGIQPVDDSLWNVPVIAYLHKLVVEDVQPCTVTVLDATDANYTVVDIRLSDGTDVAEHLCQRGMARSVTNSSSLTADTRAVLYRPSASRNTQPQIVQASEVESQYDTATSNDNAPTLVEKSSPVQNTATRIATNSFSNTSIESNTHVPQSNVSSVSQYQTPPHSPVNSKETVSWAEMAEEESKLVETSQRLPVRTAECPYAELVLPPIGVTRAMTATYVLSANEVCVQYINTDEASKEAEQIKKDLSAFCGILQAIQCENFPQLTDPRPGQACLARCRVDDALYRAEVLEVVPPLVGVRYVDYGNSEFVVLESVKMIPTDWTLLPAQCACVKWHGITVPPGAEDDSELMNGIFQIVVNEILVGVVKTVDPVVTMEFWLHGDFLALEQASVSALDQAGLSRQLFPLSWQVSMPTTRTSTLMQKSGDTTKHTESHANNMASPALGKRSEQKWQAGVNNARPSEVSDIVDGLENLHLAKPDRRRAVAENTEEEEEPCVLETVYAESTSGESAIIEDEEELDFEEVTKVLQDNQGGKSCPERQRFEPDNTQAQRQSPISGEKNETLNAREENRTVKTTDTPEVDEVVIDSIGSGSTEDEIEQKQEAEENPANLSDEID